jgi:hypothetical protein
MGHHVRHPALLAAEKAERHVALRRLLLICPQWTAAKFTLEFDQIIVAHALLKQSGERWVAVGSARSLGNHGIFVGARLANFIAY